VQQLFCWNLKRITLTPGYSQCNDLIDAINFDEVFQIDIKIGCGTYVTTLCYGSNGYDDGLGWYFNADHYDWYTYPFYEWASVPCSLIA